MASGLEIGPVVSLDSHTKFNFLEQSDFIKSAESLLRLMETQLAPLFLLSGWPGAHLASLCLISLLTEHQPKEPAQPRSLPEVQYSPAGATGKDLN